MLKTIVRSTMSTFTTWVTAAEASFAIVYIIAISVTFAYVLYLGVGTGTVEHGFSGCDIALAASIWIIGTWFLVAVDWSHSVWVVVIYVVMLGLIYCGFRSITFDPGVSGCDISLAALILITWPWFLVAVAWSHSVKVVVMDVSMLGLVLVKVRWWRHGGHRGDFSR